MKKLLSIVLSLLLTAAALVGCTLFETDLQADYRREALVFASRSFAPVTVAEYVLKPEFEDHTKDQLQRAVDRGEEIYYEDPVSRGKYLRSGTEAGTDYVMMTNVEFNAVFEEAKEELMSERGAAFAINENTYTEFYQELFDKFYTDTYEMSRKAVTKYEFIQHFNQNAESYLQEDSTLTVSALVDRSRETLIDRTIVLDEIRMLTAGGELLKPVQKQINDLWKEVYTQIDTEIFNQMTDIADSFGEDPPVATETGTAPEPQYPLKTVTAGKTELEKIQDGDLPDEEPWKPQANMAPQKGEYLRLEGLRRFVNMMFLILDQQEYLFSEEERESYAADKEKWAPFKTAEPDELAEQDVYGDLRNYFIVRYLFFNSAYDNMLISNIEKMFRDKNRRDDEVTDAEIGAAYQKDLAAQKNSFTPNEAGITAYKAALDDAANNPVLIHPFNVKQYYVKHILLPFSDAQKALFAPKGSGKITAELNEIRDSLASDIESYEIRNGFDYIAGGKKKAKIIENEVIAAMAPLRGHPYEANQKFDDLIFKYNTDPGIFNNALGYGIRYGEESTFMKEFEEGGNALYERYLKDGDKAIGSLETVVTDYGIHIMMLSSVVKPGSSLDLDDNVYLDVMQTQNVYEKYRAIAREAQETEAVNVGMSTFAQKAREKRTETVNGKKVEDYRTVGKVYDSIIKEASGN